MIPQSFIQQLVGNCNIDDIIGSYVNLKRMGRTSKGLCPFHSEKTPSFVVYQDSQSFYCFGCGAGGDAITFIKLIENLDYVESIKFLAARVGMNVPEGEFDDKQSKMKAKIYEINRESAKFFHACLKSEAGKAGHDYLKARELSDSTIVSYGLGFAPDSWSSLYDHLKKKGFTNEEVCEAAVCAKGRNGGYYDAFRNRVMFPIIDLRGNVIGFGGRVLDDSKPKYLNTPDTPVFKKSKNLFSMNFAKNEIKDKVILAEGYMDVIAINAAGFKNVVATLGTALTEEQCLLISKYAKQVVIAYDSDEAGQKATHRAINLLSAADVTAKVLKMEGAKDPDEYIKKFGKERFALLIDGATDVIAHELELVKSKLDIKTPEGKIEYLKRAVAVIADIKNPLEREVYASIIARDTGSMAETVLSSATALAKRKSAREQKQEWRDIEQNKQVYRDKVNPQKKEHFREANAEEGIIAILFANPELIKEALKRISEHEFVTEFNRRVFAQMVTVSQNSDIEFCLTAVANAFNQQEISTISGIIARNSGKINSKNNLDEYINILLNYKDRLSKVDILNIGTEDIELYRQKLRKKK